MPTTRFLGCIAVFVLCAGVAISQPPPPTDLDGPTGSVTLGPIGTEKGSVRVDSTWDKCGNDASKSNTSLYKGTKNNQAAGTLLNELVTTPAGDKGKNGGDYSDAAKLKSGDTCFAVLKVYDKDGKVILEKVAGDFTVP